MAFHLLIAALRYLLARSSQPIPNKSPSLFRLLAQTLTMKLASCRLALVVLVPQLLEPQGIVARSPSSVVVEKHGSNAGRELSK